VGIRKLTGVYQASGSLTGEVTYALKKIFRTAHCALCDITHRGIREKAEFTQCREALSFPFEIVHLDERTDELHDFTEGRTPCVVAHTDEGLVLLLDAATLDGCQGDVGRFRDALDAAIEALPSPA
jgi:hypothetical protein